MSDDDRPLGGAELDDHALQLFGAGKHSRGGKLGDVFDAYMLRHGHKGVYDDPIFNDPNWIFDDQLPEPGVVPLNIYTSAADHGALFLDQIRQGAKTGLVCDERHLLEPIPDFGFAPSLELTEHIVEDQKMIDRGERSDWQLGERLDLHHKAWFRHESLFLPSFDNHGRPVDLPDDAKPIVFKQAWELLTDVSIFRLLLGLASIAMAARVPRDGMGGRTPLPIDTWDDGTIRIDFVRNLLFVPTYDQAKPWEARLEDIRLLNPALHPEWDAGQEIMDPIPERPGGERHEVRVYRPDRPERGENVVPSASMSEEQPSDPELDAADPKYPGPWSEDDWSAGINPNIWAKWRDAEAFEKCGEFGFSVEGDRRLSEHLRADIDAGEIALGIPVSPFEGPKMVDRQTLPEVVKAISFMPTHPVIPVETVMVQYGKEKYELRVYRPERFAPVGVEAQSDQPGRGEKNAPAQVGVPHVQYVGTWRQKVDQACEELKRREIAITLAAVYDELVKSGEQPKRDTIRRYVDDYMKNFEPS